MKADLLKLLNLLKDAERSGMWTTWREVYALLNTLIEREST